MLVLVSDRLRVRNGNETSIGIDIDISVSARDITKDQGDLCHLYASRPQRHPPHTMLRCTTDGAAIDTLRL